jgi:hypothetical protein
MDRAASSAHTIIRIEHGKEGLRATSCDTGGCRGNLIVVFVFENERCGR